MAVAYHNRHKFNVIEAFFKGNKLNRLYVGKELSPWKLKDESGGGGADPGGRSVPDLPETCGQSPGFAVGVRGRQGGARRDQGAGADPGMPGGIGGHPVRGGSLYGGHPRLSRYYDPYDGISRGHCPGNAPEDGAQRSAVGAPG